MKKYLWISSVLAFLTLVICCLIGFFSVDWKEINKLTIPYQETSEKIITAFHTDYPIELDIKNAELEILPAADDKIKIVSYYNQPKNVFDIQATKEKLKIIKTNETDIEISFLKFSSESPGKIVLYLPKKLNPLISISGDSGIVRISDIHGEELTASLTNGALDISDIDFQKNISLQSTNGTVAAARLKANAIDIQTTNGLILIETADAKAGSIQIKSVNGMIDTTDLYAKNMVLLTKNGSIDLVNIKEPDYIIETLRTSTNFGEIHVDALYKNRINE